MNKSELIDAVASRTELSKAECTRVLDAVIESLTHALCQGDAVTLVGFGSFHVKNRKARTGRNPKTGAMISIPASRSLGFKPSKPMKDALN
jgi:DNA-binding protein HU-beta